MPGVIADVRTGKHEEADGTFLEWEIEGFTPIGTAERIRERTVAKFPTTLLAVKIADIETIDERSIFGKIHKRKYKVIAFIPEPSEEDRFDIGLRLEKIIEIANEKGLLANGE